MMHNVTSVVRTQLLGDGHGDTTTQRLVTENLLRLVNATVNGAASGSSTGSNHSSHANHSSHHHNGSSPVGVVGIGVGVGVGVVGGGIETSAALASAAAAAAAATAADLTTTTVVYEHHVPQYPRATLVTLCVVLGCIIVATVLGNVFVITAILVERSLQGVSNYLVLSLAVTDLLVAVLVMPLSLLNEVSVYWYLGRVLCDMWVSMDVLCCTASILHLVAIAIDRFWAVSNIDYVRRRCARQILLMILMVWLVSVAISIPPLFGWRHASDNPELSGVCMISQDHGYTIFSTVGAFYCPLVLMLVLNFKIYRAARYRIRRKGFLQGRGHGGRGMHAPVPVLRVIEDTSGRAANGNNRGSSGSDVSQDGISMYQQSCIVDRELSRVVDPSRFEDSNTGDGDYTGDYERDYSYYPGDSTTDSNPPDSYYPVDTEEPDSPIPFSPPPFKSGRPPSPPPTDRPPSCPLFGRKSLSANEDASDGNSRLCTSSSTAMFEGSCLKPEYRTLSCNHLTVPSPGFLAGVGSTHHLNAPPAPASSFSASGGTNHLSVSGVSSYDLSVPDQTNVPENHLSVSDNHISVPDIHQLSVPGDVRVSGYQLHVLDAYPSSHQLSVPDSCESSHHLSLPDSYASNHQLDVHDAYGSGHQLGVLVAYNRASDQLTVPGMCVSEEHISSDQLGVPESCLSHHQPGVPGPSNHVGAPNVVTHHQNSVHGISEDQLLLCSLADLSEHPMSNIRHSAPDLTNRMLNGINAPELSNRLSVLEMNRRKSFDVDLLSTKHLAVPESSEIPDDPVQVLVPERPPTPAASPAPPDSRGVQFHNRVKIDGDTDISETSNSLKPGADEDWYPIGSEQLEEEDADYDSDRRSERRNSGDDTPTMCCPNTRLLSVELSCMSNRNRRNRRWDGRGGSNSNRHQNGHSQQRQQRRGGGGGGGKGGGGDGQHRLMLEPPVINIRKDSCSHVMSEARSGATPSFHSSINSPSTTTTTTSGTYSGQAQLTVPQQGAAVQPQQLPRSSPRGNNNNKRARNREKEKQRREKLEMRRERKAARVLGIITGAFVLCWLPFFIVALVGPFLPSVWGIPPVLISLFLWLGYFNSLINPVIYTIFNPSFRNAFRKIFFKRLRSVTR